MVAHPLGGLCLIQRLANALKTPRISVLELADAHQGELLSSSLVALGGFLRLGFTALKTFTTRELFEFVDQAFGASTVL